GTPPRQAKRGPGGVVLPGGPVWPRPGGAAGGAGGGGRQGGRGAGGAAVRVDGRLPAELGALIGCGVATGVGAVTNTAAVQQGQSVVVVGCGGVGLSVVMGGVLVGADPVIAVDISPPKLRLAGDVGATHMVHAGDAAGAEVAAILPNGPGHGFEAIG